MYCYDHLWWENIPPVTFLAKGNQLDMNDDTQNRKELYPLDPSGKRYITIWKITIFKFGTSTISMAIFNSYVCLPEGICKHKDYRDGSQHKDGSAINLDAETPTPTVFDSKIAGSVHHLSLRLFLERSTQVSRIQENNPLSPCKGALFHVRCRT